MFITITMVVGHEMSDCSGAAKPIGDSEFVGDDEPVYGEETKYIFVRLSVLREYLRKDLEMPVSENYLKHIIIHSLLPLKS